MPETHEMVCWPVAMTTPSKPAVSALTWPMAGWWLLGIGLGVLALAGAAVVWRARRLSHPLAFAGASLFNALICRLWYRHKRIGPCTVPAQGPVIIAANHTSPTDPAILCAACPYRRIAFLIAREYADLPIWSWFVRLAECIPVRRDGQDVAATKAALRHLRSGKALGIFIEGRIPAPDERVEPKEGVALLALRTGAPVIPCHISGTVYRENVAAGFLARHRARIRFGPVVDLSDLAGETDRQAVTRATERIAARIGDLAPPQDAVRQAGVGAGAA
ncbi:MAG: lysophospholipid acyltransferase family protein [Phycisphaerae bacterium]